MLISIDHGNKQMKSLNRIFTSGLVESDTKPPFGEDILRYRGKYYSLSDKRIPYMRDKTVDERFFILTLFSIAHEIKCAGVDLMNSNTMSLSLIAGLPPAHFGSLYKRFEAYFTNRGLISFEYNNIAYSIRMQHLSLLLLHILKSL